MFLTLKHHTLDIYKASHKLVIICYQLTASFPTTEKFGLVTQIRRAALSVFLNISEGCARKSEAERRRFFEIARASLVEVDSAFDIANSLGYLNDESVEPLGDCIVRCFQMLSRLT